MDEWSLGIRSHICECFASTHARFSELDRQRSEDVSKASIAKILDVSRSALYHFIETRKIVPG